MDGLKLCLQASGHSEIQNMVYNSWTHNHYVNNVHLKDSSLRVRSMHLIVCMILKLRSGGCERMTSC
ncbi:hypothetical protein F444_22625 [Phytophthora nicotianae P1976]|uniref:Uncharacterized protein n=1 Tax=Phytophthora nicotianae P1976 TaxID=1317066 RepID=A0A080YX86_PHYNI|nr:hypothetical protein F444_22625 [Phytophthora nicotianae P1976]